MSILILPPPDGTLPVIEPRGSYKAADDEKDGPVIRSIWAPVFEPIWDQVYAISPRTAALYIFPAQKWKALLEKDALGALGLSRETMHPFLFQTLHANDRVPPFQATSFPSKISGKTARLALRLSASWLGLQQTLQLISRRIKSPAKPRFSIEEILLRIKAVEGARHGPDCLGRSLCRWRLLLNAGYEPHFHLGVYAPSRRMHAWVSVAGRHVGEDPDELVCYQPACEFLR